MAKYGYSVYGADRYGLPPVLQYSVEPMGISVLSFSEVHVTWNTPSGDYTRVRVLRNQNGIPETQEDGVIIYELNSVDGESIKGIFTTKEFYDGLDNPNDTPITPGKNIFYTVFLFTATKEWVRAGDIHDVVPTNTGATKKIIDLLPRVVTTPEQSPFGVVDTSSDLYNFLDSLAFSYEQMLTELSLSKPSHSIDSSNYGTIPAEVDHVGMLLEPNIPMTRQRALIREAIALYADKGTAVGVANYAETITGFAPKVTVSKNLLLSPQDSTFYAGTGNWISETDVIEATTDITPSELSTEAVIDTEYTCKITATGTNSMSLGENNPIGFGVPVSKDTDYVFYGETKSSVSAGLTVSVTYYDKDATVLTTDSDSVSVSSSWSSFSLATTSPSTASYATLTVEWDTATTYYVDRLMFSIADVATYEEARATTIELSPTMENYIENPSFEVDGSLWSLTGCTFSQSSDVPFIGYHGNYSGEFTSSGNWSIESDSHITLEVGIYLAVSQYVKSDDITSITATIELYDSNDALIDAISEELTVTSSWSRVHSSAVVPVDSTAAYAKYRLEGGAGTLLLDMVMAQDAYTPTDYFDGASPLNIGAIWRGTANASASMLYPNKAVKFRRLAETLIDWVPRNAFWRLTTPAGLEYTNLTV